MFGTGKVPLSTNRRPAAYESRSAVHGVQDDFSPLPPMGHSPKRSCKTTPRLPLGLAQPCNAKVESFRDITLCHEIDHDFTSSSAPQFAREWRRHFGTYSLSLQQTAPPPSRRLSAFAPHLIKKWREGRGTVKFMFFAVCNSLQSVNEVHQFWGA
jgi:hypothetical protein